MSYDCCFIKRHNHATYWKVTRSLVSYDLRCGVLNLLRSLKGHQIIGELRPELSVSLHWHPIERSPDHWWVTTSPPASSMDFSILKGHQIIGELRRIPYCSHNLGTYWKVTRSLVSYDYTLLQSQPWHLIERSPDHWWVTTKIFIQTRCSHNWKVTRSLVSYDDSLIDGLRVD